MSQLISQLAGNIYGYLSLAPGIVSGPVLDPNTVGSPITFSLASGITGIPYPTITYILFVNGSVVNSNASSGSNTSSNSGDTIDLVVNASNGIGTPVSRSSPSITVGAVQTFKPVILANPVIGKPLNYSTPGYSSGVNSQQWYRNNGSSGPVLIPGATGSTYTPSLTSTLGDSDVGAWFSIFVVTPTGHIRSQEFSTSNTVVSQTGLLSATSPSSGHPFAGTAANMITVFTTGTMRLAQSTGTSYIDTVVAPGIYAGSPTFGDVTLFPGGTIFNTSVYYIDSLTPPACISPSSAKPTTASRPAASTGIGFFTANGAIYDANGNLFKTRGMDRLHWDANQPGNDSGLFNAKANSHRIVIDPIQSWSGTNKPLMDAMVSNSVVPAPVFGYVKSSFQGTISGTTLTVISMNSGVIGVAPIVSPGSGGGFVATGVSGSTVITKQLTNTNGSGTPGKEGTYTISITATVSIPATMIYSNGTSGLTNPEMPIAAAQIWADQYNNFGPYERWMILNVCNEWGQSPSSFTATIASTVLTASGIIGTSQIYIGMKINGASTTPCTITGFGTGTGGNGTYTVDVSQTVGSSTTMTDVTWRDTNIAVVSKLRTAGYKGIIRIDAPGSGQDGGVFGRGWTLLNHSAAVLAADSQHNLTFSLHCYGIYQAGRLASLAQDLSTLSDSSNISFDIGEFGPANENGETASITTAQTLETISVAEACNLGRYDWAWDAPPSLTDTTLVYFANVYRATSNGYSTSNPADLTVKGQQVVLDPVYGLSYIAAPATVFP